jgi:hypothetical protein
VLKNILGKEVLEENEVFFEYPIGGRTQVAIQTKVKGSEIKMILVGFKGKRNPERWAKTKART